MASVPEVACVLVPREPEDPTPEQVYLAMNENEPYQVGELVDELDSNRWTIKRRLERLVEEGFVEKKEHGENATTYWISL